MDVGLALGSGGARGYAHIGVIAELKARGHRIVAVSGSSMGAVVGGLEAAGRLDTYTDWVTTLTQRDVVRLLDPTFRAPGFIRAERIMGRVDEILEHARIEELPIPYTAVATDLAARREVWFQHGRLARAMRASIAIPSALTPVMINGRLLADGGLLNPVPMEPLLRTRSDFTVGVNLTGRPARTDRPLLQSADEVDARWSDRFREVAGEVLDNDLVHYLVARVAELTGRSDAAPASVAEASTDAVDAVSTDVEATPAPGSAAPSASVARGRHPDPLVGRPLPHELRTVDVVALSMEAVGGFITRVRMATNPPDVLVEIPVDAARTWDFHRAVELIDLGRVRAREALDAAGY